MGLIVDSTVFMAAERTSKELLAFKPQALLGRLDEKVFGVSVITLGEIEFGHSSGSRLPAATRARLMRELQGEYKILPVNEAVALKAGRLNATLRGNGTQIGLADVLIAATALELGFGVLTHNVRHFSYVPGLQVIDAAAI